ncbi:MAG: hypothetical protein JRF33_09455 [Deltaproteobacteria bacterium]|nr:hypothetical protein [Deltaproteobacteria bacterium]
MKKITLLAGFLVLALAVGGCVENDRSFTIIKVLIPDAASECDYTVDDYFRSSGLMDLSFPGYGGEAFYALGVQVRNALPPVPSCETGNLYAHDIQLERVEIRYSFPQGRDEVERLAPAALLLEDQESQLLISGTFGAETEENILVFIAIQSQVGAQLYSLGESADDVTLGVSIRLIGSTLGGDRIESNEFLYPIRLCWGCLTDFACADGSYPACLPGQDSVDFELCEDSVL